MIDTSALSKIIDGNIDMNFLPVYILVGFAALIGGYIFIQELRGAEV